MQVAGDSAALALYAVHYCGNGEISGKIIPAVLTWGIKWFSGYEYPWKKIKSNMSVRKSGCRVNPKRSHSLSSSFLHMKMLKLCHKCFWLISPGLSRDHRLCERREGCTLQSKHVIFATAHWHSLQQHDNAAEMQIIYGGCIVAFIQQIGRELKSGKDKCVCVICIHSTGFSKQCWILRLQVQVVWLHLVLPWKDLPQVLLCYNVNAKAPTNTVKHKGELCLKPTRNCTNRWQCLSLSWLPAWESLCNTLDADNKQSYGIQLTNLTFFLLIQPSHSVQCIEENECLQVWWMSAMWIKEVATRKSWQQKWFELLLWLTKTVQELFTMHNN